MPRLPFDPSLLVCPDYASPDFEETRNLTRFPDEDPAATAQRLVAIWTAGNTRDRQAWTAQVVADTQAAADEERDRLKQAEADRADVAKELDKKRPKLLPLNKAGMPSILPMHCSPYAFHKLELLDYVEFYYFTPEGCHEGRESYRSLADDTFTLARSDDGLTLRSASTSRPSRKVIPDADLTWEQFTSARSIYIDEIQRAKWPVALTEQTVDFLFALERHPTAHILDYGKTVMLRVQSYVRRLWHTQLKTAENFNISVINDAVVTRISVEYLHARQFASIMLYVPHLFSSS